MEDSWDQRYRQSGDGGSAAPVLTENEHLLPASGRALDLACGLGGDALFLARRGLDTHAWDLSPVAIQKLKEAAARQGLSVSALVRDAVTNPPGPESFDVIVVVRFLDRSIFRRIEEALRPGGILFYQTFTKAAVDPAGPRNEAYRLDDGELLSVFRSLRIAVYREEGVVGDCTRGFRNEAMLVAQKPGSGR